MASAQVNHINEPHATEKKINATEKKVITVNERKDCLFALKKRFL